MNPSERYARLLTEAERRLNHLKQRIWRISMLRVLLFAAGIAALIYFFMPPDGCLPWHSAAHSSLSWSW